MKGIRKKLIFILLTKLARLGDRLYLKPNLKRSIVIANSYTTGQGLKRYNRFSDFIIISPGCEIVPSKGTPQAKELDILDELKNVDRSQIILLTFSRLNVPQKGIDIIVETALLMPSYQFIIAGPYDTTIESIDFQQVPKNVRLIVKDFSDAEKSYLFRNSDVFLAPYINEDFGITPLEANSYGKPVLYCNDSGEIVNTQKHTITGFMSKRNPKDMVKGIEYCVINKERMRLACISNASLYSWKNFEVSFRRAVFQKSCNKC